MNVIFVAADFNLNAAFSSNNATDVTVQFFLALVGNKRDAVLCAENDVINQVGVGGRH